MDRIINGTGLAPQYVVILRASGIWLHKFITNDAQSSSALDVEISHAFLDSVRTRCARHGKRRDPQPVHEARRNRNVAVIRAEQGDARVFGRIGRVAHTRYTVPPGRRDRRQAAFNTGARVFELAS